MSNKAINTLFNAPPAPRYKGVHASAEYHTMRDGTKIAVDVLLPAELPAGERLPVVMIMARYWRSMALRIPEPPNKAPIGPREDIADDLLARGFAVVIVDARGTGASFGTSRTPWSQEERADYAEIATWVQQQSWCNGNIGAVGISYEGSTAQYLVATGVEGVKSAVPMAYEFDVYTDVALPGGIFNQAFIGQWHESNHKLDNNQPSKLFPFFARLMVKGVRPVDADKKNGELLKQAIQAHQANTDVYQAISQITYRDDLFGTTGATLDDFSVFRAKAEIETHQRNLFIWGSWLDGTTADTVIRSFNTLSNPQISVIGAWKHEMTAHASPYQSSKEKPTPLQSERWDAIAQFFHQTLQDNTPPTGKTLYYYTLGEEAWKQTDTFPLPNTQTQTWHFQADHGLAPEKPTDPNGRDTYIVDFSTSTGTTNRWHTQMAQPVVYKDRAKEDRKLLTYTSAPLTEDIEITGYPVVRLFVASTEADPAFFVYLEDVDEKGIVRYLTEGQLRGIHRKVQDAAQAPYWVGIPYHSFLEKDAEPMPIGEIVEVTFGLNPTSALIRQGHRIRVAIAGADKDTFARIPTEGTPIFQVSRSTLHPSAIQLPIIPA